MCTQIQRQSQTLRQTLSLSLAKADPRNAGRLRPSTWSCRTSDSGADRSGPSRDGGQSTFVQDFGNGYRVYTYVTWTLEVAEQIRGRR